MLIKLYYVLAVNNLQCHYVFFFFSSRRRHTRFDCDWSSDVCSSDLILQHHGPAAQLVGDADEILGTAAASRLLVLARHPATVRPGEAVELAAELETEQIGRASCRERV